jgi:co-chaperonin GroES (HSP10)
MPTKQSDATPLKPVISGSEIIPLRKDVLVQDLYFGEQITAAGLVILDDDQKDGGIHPRWAKVYAVGPDNKDVEVGQWVLIEHGRWSRGFDLDTGDSFITVRRVDPKGILGISSTNPEPEKACMVRDSVL